MSTERNHTLEEIGFSDGHEHVPETSGKDIFSQKLAVRESDFDCDDIKLKKRVLMKASSIRQW